VGAESRDEIPENAWRAEENKKEKYKKDQNCGKMPIRPDHRRRRIKIKRCMMGGLRGVVIHIKCHPNRLRGYGAVGVESGPSQYFGQWLIQHNGDGM